MKKAYQLQIDMLQTVDKLDENRACLQSFLF